MAALGALEERPKVPIGSPIIQLVVNTHWPPRGILPDTQDAYRVRQLLRARPHGLEDRGDLIRMNAPHTQETELTSRNEGVMKGLCPIRESNSNVVGSNLPCPQRSANKSNLRLTQQGVSKLPRALHGRRWNGSV